jgi:FkbM family methyltransferase
MRALGDRIALGEGTIRRGPAAGLRIDATGRMPGYLLGTADHDEQIWLSNHLKPGETFYDVGANIGFFTLLGAKLVGENGAVVAFEPLPENVRQLERNVLLNQLANVRVVAEAVADVASDERTFWLGADAVARNAGRLVDGDSDGEAVRVPVTTIDAALTTNGLPPPSLMKIDVEGEEIAVQTLSRYRPLILVEVHWINEAFADFADAELAPLGYAVRTISGEPLPLESVRFHAVVSPRS